MNLKMRELPESERPYEKLELYGESMLSNSELLAIIIKTGTREETSINLAQKVLNLKGLGEKSSLRFLQDLSIEELTTIKGIGKIKAIQIKAVCELAKRMSKPINSLKITINHPQDVANLLKNELIYENREIVKVLILNTKNILLKIFDVAIGGTNFVTIEPKAVLSEALKMQAPFIILVHNHPSGDPTPSKSDLEVTDRIYDAGDLLGITLRDHIIIAGDKYHSIFGFNK